MPPEESPETEKEGRLNFRVPLSSGESDDSEKEPSGDGPGLPSVSGGPVEARSQDLFPAPDLPKGTEGREGEGAQLPGLDTLPDPGDADPETYFKDGEVQSRLEKVVSAIETNPGSYTQEERDAARALAGQAADALEGGGEKETPDRPRARVEEQGALEGLGNSLMRGINQVQSYSFRSGQLAAGATGFEDLADTLEREAEEELKEAAQYPRSQQVEEVQRKIDKAQEEDGAIEGTVEALVENPKGGLRWLGNKVVETSPTLATSAGGGAVGSAASVAVGATSPVWGPVTGAFGAAALIETGAQVQDASYNKQGEKRELTETDKVAAGLSGLAAAAPEAAGALGAVPWARFFDETYDLARTTGLGDSAAKEMVQEAAGVVKEKAAEVAGRAVAETSGGAAKGAAIEGLTEGIQSTIADVGAKYGWEPSREVGENWFEEALIGAGMGGLARGGGEAVSQVANPRSETEASVEQAARETPIDEVERLFEEETSKETPDPNVVRGLARALEEKRRGQGSGLGSGLSPSQVESVEGTAQETEAPSLEEILGAAEEETIGTSEEAASSGAGKGAEQEEVGAPTVKEMAGMKPSALAESVIGAGPEAQQRAIEALSQEQGNPSTEGAGVEGASDTYIDIPPALRSKPTEEVIDEAESAEQGSREEEVHLEELSRRAAAARRAEDIRLGQLQGRAVETESGVQGTLGREPTGEFVVRPEEGPAMEVAQARAGGAGPLVTEAPVTPLPERQVEVEVDGATAEEAASEEAASEEDVAEGAEDAGASAPTLSVRVQDANRDTRLTGVEVARSSEGNPVSVTGTNPDGEERTIRDSDVATQVAIEEQLARTGVDAAVEGEPEGSDVPSAERLQEAARVALEADDPSEEARNALQEAAGTVQQELVGAGPESGDAQVVQEAREALGVIQEEAQEGEGIGASAVEEAVSAVERAVSEVGTSSAPDSQSESPIDEDALNQALSEAERDLTGEKQTSIQAALLSGISGVEDTLDAAFAGNPEPVTVRQLEAAETWALEAMQRVDDYLKQDLSSKAEAAARRARSVLAGVDRDLTNLRIQGEFRGTQSTRTESQTDGTDPERDASSTASDSPATSSSGPPVSEAGGGPAESASREQRSFGNGAEGGLSGGIRGGGVEGAPATSSQMSEGVSLAQERVSGRAYSPQVIPAIEQGLRNDTNPLQTPSDVDRAFEIAEALQEVGDAPTVRKQEVVEAINVMSEGGLRNAARSAGDREVAQRYNQALQAMERAAEPTEGQEALIQEEPNEDPASPEAQQVTREIASTRTRFEDVQRKLEQAREELARAREDQFEQGTIMEGDARQRGGAQQSLEGLSRGSGDQGQVTAQDVKGAKETLRDLQAERDRLQNRLTRLELERDRLVAKAESASTSIELEAQAEEGVAHETEAVGVTKSGADGTYTVGLAEDSVRWESGGQTSYQRQAGQLVVRRPGDGRPVGPKSSKHAEALGAALTDPNSAVARELLSSERMVGGQGDSGVATSQIARESQSPYQIALAWQSVDTSKTIVEEEITGVRFTPSSVEEALENAETKGAGAEGVDAGSDYQLWKDGDAAQDVESFSKGLSDEMPGLSSEQAYQRVATIIAETPGGPDALRSQGKELQARLEEQFKDITGIALTEDRARLFVEGASRAQTVRMIREAEESREAAPRIMQRIVRSMEGDGIAPEAFLEEGPLSIGRQLTEIQRRALQNAWDKFHDPSPQGGDAPFSRLTAPGESLSAEAALQIIEGVAGVEASVEGLPGAEVVRAPADLPAQAEAEFRAAAAQYGSQFAQPAFVYDGTVYLVASHVTRAADAASKRSGENVALTDVTRELLLHEWGHQGMESLWGDSYTEAMAGLFEEIGRGRVREQLGSAYDARFTGDLTPQDKAVLADEFLAHHAEGLAGTDPNLLRRAVLYLKRAWNRLFDNPVSEAEMSLMLVGAYDTARSKAIGSDQTGTRFALIGEASMQGFSEEAAFQNPYNEALQVEVGDQEAALQGPLLKYASGREVADEAKAQMQELSGETAPEDMSSLRRAQMSGLSTAAEAEEALRDGVALPEVFQHNTLYDAYPELRDVTVRLDPDLDSVGGFYFGENEIVVGNGALAGGIEQADSSLSQGADGLLLDLLVHETQHKIQDIEGWQNGANFQSAQQIIRQEAEKAGVDPGDETAVRNWAMGEYGTSWRGAVQEVYRRTLGEVEAREVTRRRQMNALERAVKPPFVREDGLVLPEGEVFTQSAIPARVPNLKAKRAVASPAQRRLFDPVEETRTEGGELRAPNGEGTNLSPGQWRQVRTPEFKQWFGNWEQGEVPSAFLDENGEPRVFYHGTNEDFTVFDPTVADPMNPRPALFFSEDPVGAEQYIQGGEGQGKIMEVFVTADAVADIRDLGARSTPEEVASRLGIPTGRLMDALPKTMNARPDSSLPTWRIIEEYGILRVMDGAVRFRDTERGQPHTTVAVGDPTKVKSATQNQGSFDGGRRDIRFARRPADGRGPTGDRGPFEQAGESVEEGLESGQIDLTDLTPVRTDDTPELVAAGRPAPPDAPLPTWAVQQGPETQRGRSLVQGIENDPDGTEVGKRSVVEMVLNEVWPDFQKAQGHYVEDKVGVTFRGAASLIFRVMRDTRGTSDIPFAASEQQLQQLGRGRVEGTMTREELFYEWTRLYVQSPGTVADLQVTEAIESALDETNEQFLKALRDAARAWQAHTSRPVRAQLRSYQSDYGPEGVWWNPSTWGDPGEGWEGWHWMLMQGIARGHVFEKMDRDLFRSIRDHVSEDRTLGEAALDVAGIKEVEGTETARRVLNEAKGQNTPRNWHQISTRINGEVGIAMSGRRGKRGGIRMVKTDTDLTEDQIERLSEAGFSTGASAVWTENVQRDDGTYRPVEREGTIAEALQDANEGEMIWLTTESLREITDQVERWDAFQEYAQRKVDLARAEKPAEVAVKELSTGEREQTLVPAITRYLNQEGVSGAQRRGIDSQLDAYEKGFRDDLSFLEGTVPVRDIDWLRQQGVETGVQAYPGSEDMGVSELRQAVADAEGKNPEWEGVFREMEDFADRALLMSVAGGLTSVPEASVMKETYGAYLPLMRDIENGGGPAQGASAWPDPQFREVEGSTTPAKPLLQNFEDRLRQVMESYYHNATMLSTLSMLRQVSEAPDTPAQTKELVDQMVTEVGRLPRKVAEVRPGEIRAMIAEELGESAEDIRIIERSKPLIRVEAPDGDDIIAPMEGGDRVFYKVEDPFLLEYFTMSGQNADNALTKVFDVLSEVVAPWKRVLTQNAVFALRNGLARDPAYASFMGLPPEADNGTVMQRAKQVMPLMPQVVGIVERLTGTTIQNESGVGQLLADEIRNTGSQAHKDRLGEGGWSELNKVATEGIYRNDFFSLTLGEKLRSLPGILMSGLLKPVELVLWATGQRRFSVAMEENTRLGAHKMARETGQTALQSQTAFDRVAGNFTEHPASGMMHAAYRQAGFANPALQSTYEMLRGVFSYDPQTRNAVLLTRISAVASMTAAAWAINEMFTPDDRQEELAERPDEERMRYFPFLGEFRMPFDYGLVGTIQAFTYNLLDSTAGRELQNPGKQVLSRLVSGATDVPLFEPTGLLNPQLQLVLETEANYNFFFGEDIVPSELQYQPPEEQAFSDTPGLYKWLGKKTGDSPLMVQHVVRNGLAYPIDDFLQFVSQVNSGEADPIDLVDITDPANPSFNRLWQQNPIGWRSQSVQTVSKKANEFKAARRSYESIQENLGPDPSEAIKTRLRELQRRMQELQPYKRRMSRVREWWDMADQAQSNGDFGAAKQHERRMTQAARELLTRMENQNQER